MNRFNKTTLWFALFCSWGQYIRERQWKRIIVNNLINSFMWVFPYLLFGNKLQISSINGSYSASCFILFVVAFKLFLVTFEKYLDYPLAYTLTQTLPVTRKWVFAVRLISKISNISEIVLIFLIACLVIENNYPVILIIVIIVCMHFLEEIIALLSYNNMKMEYLLPIEALVIAYAFFPGIIVWRQAIVGCTVCIYACLIIFQIRKHTLSTTDVKRSKRLMTKKITLMRLLLLKERVLLLHHRKDILFSAVILPIVFIVTDHDATSPLLYVTLFVFDLAISYGLNYLNIEKEDIILVILLSNQYDTLLKVKTFCFSFFSLMGSVALTLLYTMQYGFNFSWGLIIIFKFIIIIDIYSLVSLFCSTVLFTFSTAQSIIKFFIGIGIMMLFLILDQLQLTGIRFSLFYKASIILTSVILYFLINRSCSYYAKNIDKKKNSILQHLAKL